MAEESSSETVEASVETAPAPAKEALRTPEPEIPPQPTPAKEEIPMQPTPARVEPESSTKGLLRDAIQKVMEEIDYHEREAKRHLQQAEALRKDLRESFSFLEERRGGGKAPPTPQVSQAVKTPEPDTKGKAEAGSAPDKQQRGSPKKKPGQGKAKKG
jgi:hypothetical protein